MSLDYFYDAQIKRYLYQVVKAFSGFKYRLLDKNGNEIERVVPSTYALYDKLVGSIIRNNSENTLMSTPQITCWLSSIEMNAQRRQTPNGVDILNVFERDIDKNQSKYTGNPGLKYTVERYMPVPYDLVIQVDIWTSNELQKHQLLEQILVLFNPSIDIQSSVNPIDWTSLTIMTLESVQWTNRAIPIGTSDSIDIASLLFRVPIMLNPPAKVKKQTLIHNIIKNILNDDTFPIIRENPTDFKWSDTDTISTDVITPNNFRININKDEVTLIGKDGNNLDNNGNQYTWDWLFDRTIRFRDGVSRLVLRMDSDFNEDGPYITGTLQRDQIDNTKLIWTIDIDTIPSNTLSPVNAILNPNKTFPDGNIIPVPSIGQRYLLTDDITLSNKFWNVIARTNDIIEFDGNNWFVSFESSITQNTQYVINMFTSQQLRWNGEIWALSIDGEYNPGFWKLIL